MNNIMLNYFGKTDVGNWRSNNEDAFVVKPLWNGNYVLAIVIDGVGGNEGGEVAAQISQKLIPQFMEEAHGKDILGSLKTAIVYADNYISTYDNSNMCCVLTAAVIDAKERKVYIAHVGDTRLYQFKDGNLEKLTKDDSLVGPLEESGLLTEEEAMNHPRRNIITKTVGQSFFDLDTDCVFTREMEFEVPTTFLLCSDGLYDMITSRQMAAVLSQTEEVKGKVNLLVEAAKDAGGRDNVTVVLVEVE